MSTNPLNEPQPAEQPVETPQVLLEHYLKSLRLPSFSREYDKVALQCAQEGVDHPRYLLRLCELEVLDRERRAMERRIRNAHFPVLKSLESFDFAAIPSLNKLLVLELARCDYIGRRENVLAGALWAGATLAPAKRMSHWA